MAKPDSETGEECRSPGAETWRLAYAVEFDVDRRTDGRSSSPFAFALADLAKWVASRSEGLGTKPDFRVAGRRDLRRTHLGESRTATWEPSQDGRLRAVRLEVVTPTPGNVTTLTTMTVREIDGRASLLISLSCRKSGSWRPGLTSAADVVQPSVLQYLLADRRITLRVGSEDQDGQFVTVRSVAAVEALVEHLRSERLPVALFHTRTLPAMHAARRAAVGLVGLASVVTLDLRASQQLEDLLPGCSPPYAGGRLLLSSLDAPSVTVEATVVNGNEPTGACSSLMGYLAPESVGVRDWIDGLRVQRGREFNG